MRKIIATALLLPAFLTAAAVPAKRMTRILRTADGTQVTATFMGDEFFHYWLAEDGTRYAEQPDGSFAALGTEASETRAQRARQRVEQVNSRRRLQRRTAGAITGNKRGIVILVNFKDRQMSCSRDEFDRAFNQTGYGDHGSAGSVRDYFLAQSYGQLTVDFDVVGPYTLKNNMKYYGGNDSYGNDLHPAEMVIEAVKAADPHVDFSDYDWDGDGNVDQVYVIYAGYGEAQSDIANTIWPHEWALADANYYGDGTGAQRVDGVWVDTYACSNELLGKSGSQMDGIGTACHEFSHCLGLPDMYDTSGNYTTNYGMGSWDLMDYGSYNGDGYVPAAFTAYERWFAGWLTPAEINGFREVKDMQALTAAPEAYVIYNGADRNEYYLIENRQRTGFDSELPAAGMLVVHVDYDEDVWYNNEVNNTRGHERVTIIPADNRKSDTTEAGDTWPQAGKTALTNTTTPAATLYNANTDGKKYLNMPLRDITLKGGLVSFTAGDRPTGLTPIPGETAGNASLPLFDLQGKRMKEYRGGVYISNGKKIAGKRD